MKPYTAVCRKNSNILFTCEHASRRIPRRFVRLGLTKSQLQGAKDLSDIGAVDVMRSLARDFGASHLTATISRLIIDFNRQLVDDAIPDDVFHAPALKQKLLIEIGGCEEIIPVPGNQDKSQKEERKRFARYAVAYQEKAKELVNKLRAHHEHVFVVQIHSFYRHYNGDERPTDIGVLFKRSKHVAHRLVDTLHKMTDLQVDANKPWNLQKLSPGAFEALEGRSDVDVLTIETDNHYLQTDRDRAKMAKLIGGAIKKTFTGEIKTGQ